jgi:hypothetical protein
MTSTYENMRRRRRPGGNPHKGRGHVAASPSRARQEPYDRERDLPRLLALWPSELNDQSLEGQGRLMALLRSALRKERQRGLKGHWTYDLARHARLLRAYECELQRLERMLAQSGARIGRHARPASVLRPLPLLRLDEPD